MTSEIKTEIEMSAVIEYDYFPEIPAHLSGLPEHSMPSEPETVEITAVIIGGTDVIDLLDEERINDLEQVALSHAREQAGVAP